MKSSILARRELEGRQGEIWDYAPPSRINLRLKCPLYGNSCRSAAMRSGYNGKRTQTHSWECRV